MFTVAHVAEMTFQPPLTVNFMGPFLSAVGLLPKVLPLNDGHITGILSSFLSNGRKVCPDAAPQDNILNY